MKISTYITCFLALTFPLTTNLRADSNRADYVIIGIGTAGAVVAKKLSDNNRNSVIALHNGKNLSRDPLIRYSKNALFTVISAALQAPLPDAFAFNSAPFQSSLANVLNFVPPDAGLLYETGLTVPQVNADDRQMLWALALPLGGASSINAGAWCRGTNEVYSQWEAIAGPLWSVSRILSTFKSIEKFKGPTTNLFARGYQGLLNVRTKPVSVMSAKFNRATIEATGFPTVIDYNDPNTPIGPSFYIQLAQKGDGGKFRVSSAKSFLNRAVITPKGKGMGKRRLRVLFESTALRTIWEGNKAVGVEYLQDGVVKQVFANKGVIVTAGLFSSAFLMHSGVGNATVLTSLGIPVKFNNPSVGQGLADQPHIVCLFATNPDDSRLVYKNSLFSQISWLPAPGGDPTSRQIRFAVVNGIPGFTPVLVDLVQPQSRGSITIASADPLIPPVIDLGELSNPADLTLYQQAFQTYVKNINIALHNIDPTYELLFPDPAILDDLPALTEFIKEEIEGNQHWQSHCKMAAFDDGGVVDSTGRVYGVQHLFVADNSINPVGMDGSPMATGYLVGANIAQIILDEQQVP